MRDLELLCGVTEFCEHTEMWAKRDTKILTSGIAQPINFPHSFPRQYIQFFFPLILVYSSNFLLDIFGLKEPHPILKYFFPKYMLLIHLCSISVKNLKL